MNYFRDNAHAYATFFSDANHTRHARADSDSERAASLPSSNTGSPRGQKRPLTPERLAAIGQGGDTGELLCSRTVAPVLSGLMQVVANRTNRRQAAQTRTSNERSGQPCRPKHIRPTIANVYTDSYPRIAVAAGRC